MFLYCQFFFFSSRRRHTRFDCDWSSDVCSSDLVSGSAYTYTYATFGELSAWFIGWMLVLEYGVSASAVAVSWTGYFLSLLSQFDIHLPAALVSAPLDAQLRPTGAIANLPAAALVMLLTWLCYVGISKSSAMNMAMVVLKTG